MRKIEKINYITKSIISFTIAIILSIVTLFFVRGMKGLLLFFIVYIFTLMGIINLIHYLLKPRRLKWKNHINTNK